MATSDCKNKGKPRLLLLAKMYTWKHSRGTTHCTWNSITRFLRKLTKGRHVTCAIVYLHVVAIEVQCNNIYCKIIVNVKYFAIHLVKHIHLIKHVDMKTYTEYKIVPSVMCIPNQ